MNGIVKTGINHVLMKSLPYSVYWDVASRYYRHRRSFDIDGYPSPTDPFSIKWVDPDSITRHTNRSYKPWTGRWDLIGTVRDGDWDLPTEADNYPHRPAPPCWRYRFSERGDYQAFQRHFVDGIPWENLERVRSHIEKAKRGEKDKSLADVLRHYERYDELYRAIKDDGYRSQLQLGENGTEVKPFKKAICNEIAVDVGRDGELLFVDGSHRLSLAKILGLDRVPVVIYVRHRKWQAIRDAIYRAESYDELDRRTRSHLSHPDVQSSVRDTRLDRDLHTVQ